MSSSFTDIFIKRPVLATVVSLLLFFLGLKSIFTLPVRQFPKMENTVISINTAYPGANADIMQGFVTTPLEKSIASAEGLDYMTSSSYQGVSDIKVYIKLNFDPNKAFTDITSKVSAVRNQLPKEVEDPVITKDTGSQIDLMYIGFNSKTMNPRQITDYITRVVQPKIETISGIAHANIYGGSVFAMRVWLDPQKMAALNLTPNDIQQALLQKNYLSAAGNTKGYFIAYNIYANTDLQDVKAFENIMLKTENGTIVRLKDVAHVELGSQYYDSSVIFNGEKAIFVGIAATPTANPLTVISDVRKALPEIEKEFPPGLNAKVVYDSTTYIRASIKEVIHTLVEATLIVVIVIFLFLGSIRSVLIPIITIPLSLVGVSTFMLALGYSINLLTLLAMVLAIGLVVDDAIVVVENIFRNIEEGLSPLNAALKGAQEIALPIIAMTITLAAVYAPIGFMTGLTGSLFKEFAFTLASAVIISGIIALTLSPMMCSKLLKQDIAQGRLVVKIEHFFENLKHGYYKRLSFVLDQRPMMMVFAVTVIISCYYLFNNTPSELAPDEDQSVIFVQSTAPQYANINYVEHFTQQFYKIFESFPEMSDYFIVNGTDNVNSIFGGMILKPWEDRKKTQNELVQPLQNKLSQVAGLQTVAFPLPSLPTSDDGLPVQFVINSVTDYKTLYNLAEKIKAAAQQSGLFLFVDDTLRFDQPQLDIRIDRDKAAELGISMESIGSALSTSLAGDYTNFFNLQGRSYQVIPQLLRQYRLNPYQLENIYVRTQNNVSVPLSTFSTIIKTSQPNSLNHFQQLNSATIEGLTLPGMSLGIGLNFLAKTAKETLPKGVTFDYAGQSRQFIQEGSALIATFFFAILIIFLVLAAQFESFTDPLVILTSVPMSICGALIPLNLGFATINIYTQIGLITLIGLISKHGILMVDFANHLQINEGLSKRDAIEKAASIRLRPILMTTAAMVMGVFPLLLAQGAGAVSRFDIGLVIATGMVIGTGFTLFMVPTMYLLLARDHHGQNSIR